ncbi:hypothetical protein NECAME_01837 [Necator americanus]|uniref:Uncharacterized protein n=1 Tax=Necator americanus TaxID=51031 RepID=W2TMN6_NECAM|nr:hypothetical protein NECAME_01837 [Necator americanus]ETN83038.1 hypothetical protein NECAME_01837 [Necator americanus]
MLPKYLTSVAGAPYSAPPPAPPSGTHCPKSHPLFARPLGAIWYMLTSMSRERIYNKGLQSQFFSSGEQEEDLQDLRETYTAELSLRVDLTLEGLHVAVEHRRGDCRRNYGSR